MNLTKQLTTECAQVACLDVSDSNDYTKIFSVLCEAFRESYLLPPTNEVWDKGNVFTPVCLSVHSGDRVGFPACTGKRGWLPSMQRNWEKAGRYASYWNAFLFMGDSVPFVSYNQTKMNSLDQFVSHICLKTVSANKIYCFLTKTIIGMFNHRHGHFITVLFYSWISPTIHNKNHLILYLEWLILR